MKPILSNAPLFLTLAQVKFNQLPKLNEVVADILEAVRQDFPDQTKVQEMEFIPPTTPNSQPQFTQRETYRFGDIARLNRFELSSNALTLVSSDYPGYAAFSSMFMKVLGVVHTRVQLQMVERLGLRYCDRVMPRENESLDQYVASEVLGLPGKLGGTLAQSYSEALLNKNNVNLLARVLVNTGPLMVPPGIDLQGLEFPVRFKGYTGRSALLDNDGFVEQREVFSLGHVEDEFLRIHAVIGDAFELITTEHAHDAWK